MVHHPTSTGAVVTAFAKWNQGEVREAAVSAKTRRWCKRAAARYARRQGRRYLVEGVDDYNTDTLAILSLVASDMLYKHQLNGEDLDAKLRELKRRLAQAFQHYAVRVRS